MTAGYSTEGAIIYTTPNATSLNEPLNEAQISWFRKSSVFHEISVLGSVSFSEHPADT